MAKEQLIIFDTTMRDGEQSPGASMTKEEKIRIGRQLERMKVDVIEAGFPAASDGDFDAVQAVARTVKDSIVCGLARANESDIRRCGEAVRVARKPARAHLHRDLADPHGEEAPHGAFAGDRSGGARGQMGARIHGQHRVLARGRRPLGHRFPLPHPRAGDQGRRDDDQRARYRRLHAARACSAG